MSRFGAQSFIWRKAKETVAMLGVISTSPKASRSFQQNREASVQSEHCSPKTCAVCRFLLVIRDLGASESSTRPMASHDPSRWLVSFWPILGHLQLVGLMSLLRKKQMDKMCWMVQKEMLVGGIC